MCDSVTITMENTVPVAQPRHRVGNGRHYQAAANHKIHGYKQLLGYLWLAHGRVIDPVGRVTMEFVFPRTKKMKPGDSLVHRSRPDVDNLAKAVMDGLNQLAWKDDSQIVDLRITKRYTRPDECPYVRITIERMSDGMGCS